MIIKRVFNNNVAMVDDRGVERIAIGCGIAFQKHRGDSVDPSTLEKLFTLDDPASLNRLERLVKGIPSEYLALAEEIVAMLRTEPSLVVDDNVLIALTDHISLSLERERAGVPCENPLLSEIKAFYRKEFALALRAKEIIKRRTGISISEEEVGFIALHIVNASMHQRADHLVLSIQMIQEIFDIVGSEFDLEFDEGSIQYERFLRHLQFFAQRVFGSNASQSDDTFLFNLGKDQFPAAFECTERIRDHVRQTYKVSITDAECGYLAYHIMNLVHAAGAPVPQPSARTAE